MMAGNKHRYEQGVSAGRMLLADGEQLKQVMVVRNWQTRITSHPVLLIILLGLFLNLPGTFVLPLIDRDEPRFAEASREMAERREAVVPTFNGAPRYDKPPMVYWAQIASFTCLGQSAVTARLPSALFAIATALTLFYWGRRAGSSRAGLLAAVILLTCVQMLMQSRLSVADTGLVFFVTLCGWSGWEMLQSPLDWRWWWIFYASLGLGFLAKGPEAWLPLGGLLVCQRRGPSEFKLNWPRLIAGLLLTSTLVALWGIPAILETKGEFVKIGLGYHVIHRSFGVLEGHGMSSTLGWVLTAPFFFLTFFLSFAPWSFRFVAGCRCWWPGRNRDPLGNYLLIQAALFFLVFTVVRTKLPHYTLPAFPSLALWLARADAVGFVPRLNALRKTAWVMVLTILITVGGGILLRPFFLSHNLYEAALPQLSRGMKIAAIGYDEPSLIWEFRQTLTNHIQFIDSGTPLEAREFLDQKPPFILISRTEYYESNLISWSTNLTIVKVQGLNWTKGKSTALTAIIHP